MKSALLCSGGGEVALHFGWVWRLVGRHGFMHMNTTGFGG